MIAALALAGTASAGDLSQLQLGLTLGGESVLNDPFVNRGGPRLGVELAPVPWARLTTAFTWFPVLGDGGETGLDWSALGKQRLPENGVSPDISNVDWTGQVALGVRLYAYEAGRWTFGVGLQAGAAAVHSVDDADSLQVDPDDPAFAASDRQVHLGPVYGAYWEARVEHVGVRVRLERVAYIETINGSVLEMKDPLVLGGECTTWF